MSERDVPDINFVVLTIFPELVIVEVGAQVCDNPIGEAVVVHNFVKEVKYSSSLGQVTSFTSIHLVNFNCH